MAKKGWLAAMKDYFGLKEGQTPMQFGQEVLSLDDKDRKEFYDTLVAQGIDCDPPTPKVKK